MAWNDPPWTEERINTLCAELNQYAIEASKREYKEVTSEKGFITIIPPDFPSVEEFIVRTGFKYSKYLYELEKKHERVSDAITCIRLLQAQFLQKYGLNGQYNPVIAKVAAINNKILNWRDKSEVDTKHAVDAGALGFFGKMIDKSKTKK